MKIFYFIPFLLLTLASFGQQCVQKNHLSLSARMQKYPFNIASQVQMVGYDGLIRMCADSFYVAMEGPYGYIDVPIKERRMLTASQVDSLTNILYNYGYAYKPKVYRTIECYDPHNAIVFLDKNGKPLAFMELCFECKNTTQSDEKISLGDMCDQKLDMLKQLFRQVGIKRGV